MSLAGVTTIPGTTNMLVAELLTTQGAAVGGRCGRHVCQSHLCVFGRQPVARVPPSTHAQPRLRLLPGCCRGHAQPCSAAACSHCCSSAVCCCCCCSPGMGANLVALYDYNRVITSGSSDHQPLQRFVGHTDVVTAVAAGDDVFKECFLSGAWWGAAGRCCAQSAGIAKTHHTTAGVSRVQPRTAGTANRPAGRPWCAGLQQGCVQQQCMCVSAGPATMQRTRRGLQGALTHTTYVLCCAAQHPRTRT